MQECDQVLQSGIFNTASITANLSLNQTFNEFIYASDFSTHQQAIDAGISIGTIVYGVPVQLNGTYSKQQKDTWRSNNQQFKTATLTSVQKYQSMISIASPDILEAWTKCKETTRRPQVGLYGWIQEVDNSSALLYLYWSPSAGDNGKPPVVKSSSVLGGVRADNSSSTVLPKKYQLIPGPTGNLVGLTRNPNEALIVVVSTSRGDVACILKALSKPSILSFISSLGTIDYGVSSILTWAVSGATQVDIDNGIGSVQTNGSITVTPTISTTYKLTASNSSGTISQFTTINVNAAPKPAPVLTGASVSFYTTDNDKDKDTNVEIYIKAAGQTVAKWSGGKGTRWGNNTDNGSFNLTVLTPIKKDQLIGIGQAVLVESPNGADEWHFNWSVILTFSDGSQSPYNWGGGNVDHDRTTITQQLP